MDNNNALNVLYRIFIKYYDIDDNFILYTLDINFREIKTFDGSFGLLSSISSLLQEQITLRTHEIKITYMNTLINLIDLKTFIYFCSCNILLDTSTYLTISKKSNISGDYEETEVLDMITANSSGMKPISKKLIVKCSVCSQFSDNDYYTKRLGPLYGPFKYSNCKYYAHFLCLLWLPKVYFADDQRIMNAGKEINRAKKERCSYCNIGGAGLACWMTCENKCIKAYHYLCAKSVGCYFNKTSYGILCPRHKKKYVIPDREELKDALIYKKENVDELMVCDVCKMTCDQDKFLVCGECKKSFHEQCVGYCSNENKIGINSNIIVEDDSEEGFIENNEKEYVCFNCKVNKEKNK